MSRAQRFFARLGIPYNHFQILHRGTLYLERWSVTVPRLGWTVKLHHIIMSDPDPELHDHPWDYASLILWGSYREVTAAHPEGIRYRAGRLLLRRADHAHRLLLDRPAWTLVVTTAKKRPWGFHAEDGWTPWKQFVDARDGRHRNDP